jgi:hypothetical protein
MSDQLGRVLMVLLLGAAAPLLGITAAARRERLTLPRAVVAGALSEIPVALAAGAFIFFLAECVTGPCPVPSLWERLQWWIMVGTIGALDGAAVALLVMSIRWALRRVRRAA